MFNTAAFIGKNASGKTTAIELLDCAYSIPGDSGWRESTTVMMGWSWRLRSSMTGTCIDMRLCFPRDAQWAINPAFEMNQRKGDLRG